MGYYSTIEGHLEISPELSRDYLRNYANFYDSKDRIFYLDNEDNILADEDSVKICSFNELEEIILSLPEGTKIVGYFQIQGEEGPNIYRLYINDRREIVKVKPKITWPDMPDSAVL